MEGPTPVLFVATVNDVGRCRDGKPCMTWHAISLPAHGTSVVSQLDADCMVVWRSRGGICAWVNTGNDRRRSRLYRIDPAGNVIPDGDRPAGVCPS